MSSIPSQIRTIDSFAEYNSNVANRLTRMLSGNENVLMSANSLQATVDTTSPLTVAVIQSGMVFKDDVFIEITADHEVDFLDSSQYINPAGGILDQTGNYYIVLEYTYVKSRPAPVVNIKIIRPDERASAYPRDSLMLLSVVKVVVVGPANRIDLSDPFHNFDDDDEDNRRVYVKSYVGSETLLPTHDTFDDQSRIAYDTETDKFWLGYRDHWTEFGTGGSVINIDTTGTTVGEICYVDSTGSTVAAIATALNTGGDVAIVSVGLAVDSSGKALTSGVAENVPIETAVVITTGDLLYLSNQEAGKVTRVQTSPFYQVIGRAITSGDSANPIDIIFTPKVVLATAAIGQIPGVASVLGWQELVPASGEWYHDIDISDLGVFGILAVLSNFFDNSTEMQIVPLDVEIRDTGDTLRVWMSVSSITVNYIVSTGGGGAYGAGGGGGGSDHSLLLNLDYASAGHSGFAPSPHGNGDHSGTYIESAGVTYAALLANADIGPAVEPFEASKVAPSIHSHGASDIPTGAVMLFAQSGAPVGWTKKTTGFTTNASIVVTIGSGGGQGGSQDSRSFNPAVSAVATGTHSHTISTQLAHAHSFSGTTGASTGGTVDQGDGNSDAADDNHVHNFSGGTGNSGAHSHGGATGTNGNHNHTINYSSFAPYYWTVIAATKD